MHRCLKCGRSVASVNEIAEGCPCGSKVFVFQRLPSQGEEMAPLSTPHITLIPAIGDEAPGAKTSAANGNVIISPAPSSSAPAFSSSPASPPSPQAFSQSSPLQSPAGSSPSPTSPENASHLQPVNPPAVASSLISSDADEGSDCGAPYSEVWLTKGGRIEPLEGAVPITGARDVSAGLPAAAPDVANVRQLKRGV